MQRFATTVAVSCDWSTLVRLLCVFANTRKFPVPAILRTQNTENRDTSEIAANRERLSCLIRVTFSIFSVMFSNFLRVVVIVVVPRTRIECLWALFGS